MRKRLVVIGIIVFVAVVLFIAHPSDPCAGLRRERERTSEALATLDVRSDLARYAMQKNAALYDEMERQGCTP